MIHLFFALVIYQCQLQVPFFGTKPPDGAAGFFTRRYHRWRATPLMSLRHSAEGNIGMMDLQKEENDGNFSGISKNLVVFCSCFSETEYGFHQMDFFAVFEWIWPQIEIRLFKWFEFRMWCWGCVQQRWVSSSSRVETPRVPYFLQVSSG